MSKNNTFAASQLEVGNLTENLMATAIANEAEMVTIENTEEQKENTTLRIIKIKPAENPKMFRTLAKAIAAGATTLIVTTRVDVVVRHPQRPHRAGWQTPAECSNLELPAGVPLGKGVTRSNRL